MNKQKNRKRFFISITIISLLIMLFLVIFAKDLGIMKDNSNRHNNSDGTNEIDRMIEKINKENKFSANQPDLNYETNVVGEDEDIPSSIEYDGTIYYANYKYIDKEYVGGQISIDEETGWEIFEIKSMINEFFVALKDDSKDIYYIYCCAEYNVESLGQFLEETGFYDTTEQLKVWLSSVKENDYSIVFYDNIEEYIMKNIGVFAQDLLVGEYNDESATGLSISYVMKHVKSRVNINFYENGDVFIECTGLGVRPTFNAGDEGIEFATDLMEYLVENAKVYKVEY